MRRDLVAARGRVNKLSFFVHNFMDACRLEKDRIEACVFMAATQDGPISMCLHNAKRDAFFLDPLRLERADGAWYWDPVSGELTRRKPPRPQTEPRAHGRAGARCAAQFRAIEEGSDGCVPSCGSVADRIR
jgi:hypothetical protein